ncbi:MAG: Ref family recombination enhancement nuclease [Mycobacterium sp.]|nr:Ref family recombination enhancement nuclease [Mycobacterium sp.]
MPTRATAAEKRHMDRVAQIGCVLCAELGQAQTGRTTLHHPREGQGAAQRSPNWLVIPLCEDCHQGALNGIHGQRAMWKLARWTELDALAATIERLS